MLLDLSANFTWKPIHGYTKNTYLQVFKRCWLLSLVSLDLFLFVGSAMCVSCLCDTRLSLKEGSGFDRKNQLPYFTSSKSERRASSLRKKVRLTLSAVFQDAAILSVSFVPAINKQADGAWPQFGSFTVTKPRQQVIISCCSLSCETRICIDHC